MKIARCLHNKRERWAFVEGQRLVFLKFPPFVSLEKDNESAFLDEAELLVPAEPEKIVLVGLNYRDHAGELGMSVPEEPVLFMKSPCALIPHGGKIIYPGMTLRVEYEAELALVIRKEGKDIPPAKAHEHILGYMCLNDVTARDLQKKDGQWTRAKSFDTFCPAGPWLETDLDPSGLKIRAFLNGQVKQDSSTAEFIFSVPEIVSFISRVMTLKPGDIISTGTPPGVGEMKPGDTVEIEIEGIGRLKNIVK